MGHFWYLGVLCTCFIKFHLNNLILVNPLLTFVVSFVSCLISYPNTKNPVSLSGLCLAIFVIMCCHWASLTGQSSGRYGLVPRPLHSYWWCISYKCLYDLNWRSNYLIKYARNTMPSSKSGCKRLLERLHETDNCIRFSPKRKIIM